LLAQCDDSVKSALVAGMRCILANTLTGPTKLLCHGPHRQSITPQQLSNDRLNSAMAPTSLIQNDRAHFFHAEDGRLVGYVLWATLSPETEARVLAQRQMQLEATEWREGTSLWIVDLYCQPGRLRHVLAKLRDEVFGSERRVRYMRQRRGISIPKEIARDSSSFVFRQSEQPSCHCARPLAACAMYCAAGPAMAVQATSAPSVIAAA